MTTAIRKKADYYEWQPHRFKGCYVLYRWVKKGRERTVEAWGGSKGGKPLKVFASLQEAIAKAEELNT